jgi:hypothetical protein
MAVLGGIILLVPMWLSVDGIASDMVYYACLQNGSRVHLWSSDGEIPREGDGGVVCYCTALC